MGSQLPSAQRVPQMYNKINPGDGLSDCQFFFSIHVNSRVGHLVESWEDGDPKVLNGVHVLSNEINPRDGILDSTESLSIHCASFKQYIAVHPCCMTLNKIPEFLVLA